MAAGAGHDRPMVSCLTVALPAPSRLEPLKRSLAAYCNQTWDNRELVLVLNGGEPETAAAMRRAVGELGRNDIRIVEPPGVLTLGALRNISWREARGEVLCQWDDDDLYHPERVERQLAALMATGGLSTCLQEAMQFFPASRRLVLTNWAATPAAAKPGTLMCLKSAPVRYPETGPVARLGEDSLLLEELQRLGGFHGQPGAPHLYVYVSHGDNTCSDDHHAMIAQRLAVSQGLIRRREAALREGLAPFEFGPGEVSVEGRNGPAFTLAGKGEWL